MMKTTHESGFSLLELVMAMMLTVGILGAVFALVNQNQQVFVTEMGVVDINQNMRTCVDLLTRDIQSSGVGLPVTYGNFASIFYTNGDDGAPDSLLMLNGDPFAPVADVTDRASGSAEFILLPPPDVTVTGNGSNQTFTYTNREGTQEAIYQSYEDDPKKRKYIVYDENHAMVFTLTQGGQLTGSAGNERLHLNHNPGANGLWNPPSVFGTPLDTQQPVYENSSVAILGSTLGYRLNPTTRELERTEDLQTWYTVARGIIDFQLEFRVVLRNAGDKVEEKVTRTPGDGTDATASGELTTRRDIRSVIITIRAETPDLRPGDKGYKQVLHRFEVTPRNLNLVNNNNLSMDQ